VTFGIGDGVSSAWGATSDRSSSPRKLLGDDCLAAAPPPLQSGNLPSSIHSTHLTVVAQSILVRSTTGRLDLQFVIPVGRGSPLTPSRCSMEGTRGPSFGLNWVGSSSGTTSPELCNFHLFPSTTQPIPTKLYDIFSRLGFQHRLWIDSGYEFIWHSIEDCEGCGTNSCVKFRSILTRLGCGGISGDALTHSGRGTGSHVKSLGGAVRPGVVCSLV